MKTSLLKKLGLSLLTLGLFCISHLQAQTVTGNNTTSVSIPDNDDTGASRNVSISGVPAGAILLDVEVDIAINHTWIGDLRIQLESPDGDSILMLGRPGLAGAPGTGDCCGDASDFSSAAPITFTDTSLNDPESMGSTIGGSDAVCAADGICDYFPNDDSGNPVSFTDLATTINGNCGNINGDWIVRVLDGAGGDTGDFTVPELRVSYVPGTPPVTDPVITGTAGDDSFEISFLNGALTVMQNSVMVLGQCAPDTNSLTINAGDGDDTLTIDFDGGNYDFPITFNGEGQNTIPGDLMQFTGGTSYGTITHTFVTDNDGNVDISGNNTITYTGLEPIVDNLDAVDRIFTFTGGAETITLDAGGTLDNQIDSTLGESVDFNNPTGSLTINAGTGDDIINMEGVGTGFDADLNVSGDDDNDTINFQTTATNVANGAVTITAEVITVGENLSSTGAIALTGDKTVAVLNNAIVAGTNGDITIVGGNAPSAGDNFLGVRVDSGTVRTTGTGNISITGIGSFTSVDFRHGITVRNAGVVEATGAGSITFNGTAGNSLGGEGMLIFENARIESNGGGISLTGQGGNSAFGGNRGINFTNGTVQDLNGGSITLNGQASGTGSNNSGVFINTSTVATSIGSITLNGTGSTTGIDNNFGVGILTNASVSSNGGAIIITGNGNGTGNINRGLRVIAGSSISNTGNGTITLNGTSLSGVQNNNGIQLENANISGENGLIQLTGVGFGDGTASVNRGIELLNASTITSTGSGSVAMIGSGGDGIDNNHGIGIFSGSTINTFDGNISLNGTGGNATGNANYGVTLSGGAAAMNVTGTGNVNIVANAMNGASTNRGYNASNAVITTNGGGITINGTGADTSGSNNQGIYLNNNAGLRDTNGGTITLIGSGGNSAASNHGVLLTGNTVFVETTNGIINITGVAGDGSGNSNIGVLVNTSTVQDLGTGDINITGTGGDGAALNRGVEGSGAIITSNGGNISLDGFGGNATGNSNVGTRLRNSSQVSTVGNGSITINGTGGLGNNANLGSELFEDTIITSENGDVSITGSALDTTGSSQDGVRLVGTFRSTGTGNISINGTAGTGGSRAISINSLTTLISASNGDVTLDGPSGFGIITPSGIPPAAIVEANTITVNGNLRTGNTSGSNLGLFPVTGDLVLANDDNLLVNIGDFVTAGTDYDQVTVNGALDITDAILSLVDNTNSVASAFEILVLIDNDGTDPVIGNFNGLPNESAIAFNGETWYLYYDQGDGNDVVLRSSAINVEVDAAGNLVYNDPLGEDDDLTIIIDGTNYRISDANKPVIAGQGAIQDGDDALVPIASVTGDININTEDGDDSLNVDFDGGDYADAINYDGGNQNTVPGDIMQLSGAASFASVNHNFVNENDGSVEVDGNSTISYVGLEPIIDNLDVADRTFTFTGGAETITLDAGGILDNQIDSTLGEMVDFNNPTASLTINAGTGDDIINIEGVAAGFDADLTVNGDDDDDDINFQTNGTDIGNGNLLATSEQLFITTSINTTANVTTTSDRNTFINGGSVQTTDGAITITGGTSLSSAFNYRGIDINAGIVEATGTGSVTIAGSAGNAGSGNNQNGVFTRGATVLRTVTGALSITGDCPTSGNLQNMGVRIDNPSLIESTDGDITIIGTGGAGTGNFNLGVAILFNGVLVQTTGLGAINVEGTSGEGAVGTYGILFQSAQIRSAGGGITATGNPGTVTGNSNSGIAMLVGATIEDTGAGNIELTGTGSSGNGNNNNGFVMSNSPVNSVITNDGNINITGFGANGTGSSHDGILLVTGSIISSTGIGSINLNGTGGTGNANHTGIEISDSSSVQTNGGGIILDGTGGTGTGDNNNGIQVQSSATVQDVSGGTIIANGTATSGNNDNSGILVNNGSMVTTTGSLTLDGQGGGTGNDGRGIFMENNASISSSTGNINLTGTGSPDANGGTAFGIRLEDNGTQIETIDGAINLNGTGGSTAGTAGDFNYGVAVLLASRIEALGLGSISILGQGGNSTGLANRGIDISSNNTLLRTNGGGISINGTGGTGDLQAMGTVTIGGPTIQDTANGNIDIVGIGGSGNGNFYGGIIVNDTDILGGTGSITMNGTGGTGTGNLELGIRVLANTTISTAGSGTITMNGTGGTGTDSGFGIQGISGASITSENGDITLFGEATDAAGTNHDGIQLEIPITTTGTGNIIITGNTANPTDADAISLQNADAQLTAGGDITVNSIAGFIATPDGVPGTTQFDATNTIINGTLAPGQSPGQATVNGAFDIGSGDTLEMEISAYSTAGIDYDQLVVTGTVSITDATLTMVDLTGAAEDECVTIVLIDNDGTDAIVGTFAGIAEGDSITFGNITGKVSYVGGDGNDFVLNLDDTAPIISCPTDVITGTDPGLCSAMVTFSDAIAADNCGIATVVQTAGLPSGSDFPVGVSTVEYTATDVNGNETVCSFTITVNDDEPAVAVCQDITIQLDATGVATITSADVDGGSTDNCGIASLDIDMDTFDCSNVGDNTVTLTVTDDNGNVSTCTAVVTVEDVTAPDVVCQDITVQLDDSGSITISPTDVTANASDACGIASASLDIDTFDCSNIGDNTVTLTVTDTNGNSTSCTAIVTVEDVTDPEVVCMDITVELDENGMAVITPEDVATFSDNCGILTTAIDIFEFNCDDVGTPITVQVFANDDSGNLGTCTAVVTVVDAMAPEITCPADQTVDPGPGNLFYEIPDYFANGEASAVDNCTDPVTITSQDPAPGTLVPDGVYTIALTAEDEYGNVATCEFELTVESVLGLDDVGVDLSSIVMYPNPAVFKVYISNPTQVALDTAAIYDLNGRLVQTIDLSNMGTEMEIDVSNLSAASYLVQIQGASGFITKTLIKE